MGDWKFKSCPRCGGDLFIAREVDNSWYEQCLQCSFRHELARIAEPREQPVKKQKKPVLA